MKLSRSEKSFFMHGQKELWSCGFHRNPERDYPDNSCLPLCVVNNNWRTTDNGRPLEKRKNSHHHPKSGAASRSILNVNFTVSENDTHKGEGRIFTGPYHLIFLLSPLALPPLEDKGKSGKARWFDMNIFSRKHAATCFSFFNLLGLLVAWLPKLRKIDSNQHERYVGICSSI